MERGREAELEAERLKFARLQAEKRAKREHLEREGQIMLIDVAMLP